MTTEADPPKLSTAETIVRDILRGLYEGRYVSGQRLAEPDLVNHYSVSRSTVREAVKRLAAQGVVETRYHQGARIRHITSTEARNILLIAEMVIGLAARQAALRIDEGSSREQLQEAVKALSESNDRNDRFEFILARNRFHRTMARIADSPVLEQTLANLHVHLVRNKLVMKPKQRAASYSRIADAIFAGDAASAEKYARDHVRAVIDLLEPDDND